MKTAPGLLAILFTVSPALAQAKPTPAPDPKPEVVQLSDSDSTQWLEGIIAKNSAQAQIQSIDSQIAELTKERAAAKKSYDESQLSAQAVEAKAVKDAGKDPTKFGLSYNAQTRQFSLVPKQEKKP